MNQTEIQDFVHGCDVSLIKANYQDGEIFMVENVKNLFPKERKEGIKIAINTIAVCTEGKMQMQVDGQLNEIKKHQIFVCPPEVTIDNIMVSSDFEFCALCITNEALSLCLHSHINEWNHIMYVKRLRIFTLNDDDFVICTKAIELLKLIINKKNICKEGKRNEVIHSFVASGILGLCLNQTENMEDEKTTPKQNMSIFNRFLDLLQSTAQRHKPIDYYASALCISSKYLTDICKKNSGKTAYDWIQEYTLNDITFHLKNTQLSIKEICMKLGFPNTSFFGKYVKDAFGCSPGQYRNQLRQNG